MHFVCGAVPAAAVHWDGAAVPVWAGSAAGHSVPVGEHLAAAAGGRHSAGAAVPAGDTPAAVRRCAKHIRRPAAAGSRSGSIPAGRSHSGGIPAVRSRSEGIPAGRSHSGSTPAGRSRSGDTPAGRSRPEGIPAGRSRSGLDGEPAGRSAVGCHTGRSNRRIQRHGRTWFLRRRYCPDVYDCVP